MIRALKMLLPLLVMLFLASPVYAADDPATGPAPAQQSITCSQYAGLLHRLAGCMRDAVDYTAGFYFYRFGDLVTDAIGAFLTLTVIIYGVLLAWGLVENVGRDTLVLLIKISAVFYFVANSQLIFDTITEATDGAAFAVVTYTPPSSVTLDAQGTTTAQVTCMNQLLNKMATINPDKRAIAPWLAVDCLLDTVVGIKGLADTTSAPPPLFDGPWFNEKYENPDPTKSNPGLARGLIFFLTSSIQTSVMGAVLAVAGFVFIFGLLAVIIRAFFIYMMGYIGLAFLVVVSPLIIPLVLVQQTKQYFDKWVKLLFSFALQPVLSLVFVIFMLTAVDLATFSGSYSMVYRIAGDKSRATNFDLNYYLTALRDPTSGALVDQTNPPAGSIPIISEKDVAALNVKAANASSTTALSTDKGGVASGMLNSPCTESDIKKDTTGIVAATCNTAYGMGVRLDKINWLLMAKARTPVVKMPDGSIPPDDAALQKQIANEVIASVIFACLVVFVLNGLTKLIPTLLVDVIGDVGQTPNLFNAAGGISGGFGGIGDKLSKFADTARSKITGK